MQQAKRKSGFTLIEMIIAIGLIGVVSSLASAGLVNIMQSQKTINMNQAVAEDSRIILSLLAAEIENNAIDYEEYYNDNTFGYDFGKKYGEYGKEFYDSNDNPTGKIMGDSALECSTSKCAQGHLSLINTNGMEKIIYALKKTDTEANGEKVLSVLHLYGCDSNADGIAEKFLDTPDNCGADPGSYTIAELSIGTNLYGGWFAPVSSTRTDIVDLKFYITPDNDPYKAYAMPEYVYQPSVTIVLTVKPSKKEFGAAADRMKPKTLWTMTGQQLISEVKSYK